MGVKITSRMDAVRILLRSGVASRPHLLAQVCWKQIRRRVHSTEIDVGFSFDLADKFSIPHAKIPVRFRRAEQHDIESIFCFRGSRIDHQEIQHAIERIFFLVSGIGTCYVGVAEETSPCVIAWLISAESNEKLKEDFRGGVPALAPRDVMCEFIYTHPDYRGNGLMRWITMEMWALAREQGFQRVLTLVHSTNELSLKKTRSFDWQPLFKKKVEWRLFRRQIAFDYVASGEKNSRAD